MKPYFSSPQRIAALHQELKEWIGTPFVKYQARKRVGTDCVRFAAAVMQNLNAVPIFKWPRYIVRHSGQTGFDLLCSTVETVGLACIYKTDDPPEQPPLTLLLPGDILVFSTGKALHHMGVFSGNDRFYHCLDGYGVTEACLSDSTFAAHLLRVYRITQP